MSRVRRRLTRDSTAIARWERDREWQMSRCQPGERPVPWWKFESDRPELAGGPDTYVHLQLIDGDLAMVDNPKLDRARERLRHLRDTGELRPDEITEIHRLAATSPSPGRWTWRSAVLRETAR